jgi:RNA polymerase sigma factor (sigma-70 family)
MRDKTTKVKQRAICGRDELLLIPDSKAAPQRGPTNISKTNFVGFPTPVPIYLETMTSDLELLQNYADRNSEEAFAELIRRHLDLVYSAALRQVRSPQLAEEVAQSAFTDLARNVGKLKPDTILTAWLYQVARRTAIDVVRRESRRQLREQIASEMNAMNATASDWTHVEPFLDEAMDALDDTDRTAVLLRYFENKSLREVGQTLGTTEDAAQKRVSRAVERLREFFSNRNVTIGASGLVVVLSANAVQAAPIGLAVTISIAAVLAGTAVSTSTVIAATKAIAMTTLQKTLITATIAAAVGMGIYEAHQASTLRAQVQTLQQQQAPLAEQIQQLQRERDEARTRLDSIQEEKERWTNNTAELLQLRGMAGVARRAIGEAEQLRAQLARQTSEATNNPITGAMADAMKQAMEQQVEGRLSRMTASLHLTPEQAEAARDILMRQAQVMSAGMQQAFSGKYDKEEIARLGKEAGNPDEQIKALLTPDQQASFPAYQQEEAAHTASQSANTELLQMQSTLGLTAEQMDRVYAALYEFTFNQLTGSSKQKFANQGEAMQWALEQKTKALEPLLTETQLENYRQQQALQAKLVKDIMNKMEGSGGTK